MQNPPSLANACPHSGDGAPMLVLYVLPFNLTTVSITRLPASGIILKTMNALLLLNNSMRLLSQRSVPVPPARLSDRGCSSQQGPQGRSALRPQRCQNSATKELSPL